MKKLISTLLAFCLPMLISAQNLLTIGEVFDFDIGDEFQFTEFVTPQTPNADRITITDKYYSSDSSIVYYVEFHNSYYTQYGYGEISYYFWTRTDTVSYSNLDSSISTYDLWYAYDTSMFYYDTINSISENYCDSTINGFFYLTYNSFPSEYSNVFGKGLGWVRNYSKNIGENLFNNELFYYKKNGIGCGTPDEIYLSVKENDLNNDFIISPNPANQYFNLGNKTGGHFRAEIYNIAGELILSKEIDSNNSRIECNTLNPGMSVVCIISDSKKIFRKLIIQ